MKLIHTADWHLGKLVHGIHMTEDQAYILEQFVQLVKEEKPDAVIVAGDLYDRSVPPVEAVELLDQTFTKILVELGTPILAIAGNHDSPDRVGFVSKVLRDRGLYIDGKVAFPLNPVVLEDEHGPVNFYLLPYAEPAAIKKWTEVDEIQGHDDAMRVVVEKIKETMDTTQRNVLIGHAFVLGGEESESERPLSIGGTGCVDAKHFEPFNYTALGHLHRPQKVMYDKVRYSGSLLKYSFSEATQKKSISIVTLDGKGEIEIEQKSLQPKRDLRKIEGYLDDLLDPKHFADQDKDDYLMVTLLDEGQIIDPIGKLRSVYPNVLRLERKIFKTEQSHKIDLEGKDHNQISKLELFGEFYQHMTESDFSEEKSDVIKRVLENLAKQEREEKHETS